MRQLLQKGYEVAAKLIQIYYADEQRSKIFDFSEPYFNASLTVFFENSIIADLVPKTEAKSIAICSWKLKEKLRWNVPGPTRPRELTQEVLNGDYEVLSFTRNSKHHRMFEAAEVWHPGFMMCFDWMMRIIGFQRPSEVRVPIYQNHFSARIDVYQDYVKRYLKPAIEAFKHDSQLYHLAMADSHYSQLTRESAEHLKGKIGINYYPLVPFLLERLFSVYCSNERLNIQQL